MEKPILVAVDFSDVGHGVIEVARDSAAAFDCELLLIHVADPDPEFVGYEPGPQSVRDAVAKRFHKEHSELQGIAKSLREGGLAVKPLLIQGVASEKIVEEAAGHNARLIVMGTHGHGALRELLVGSTSHAVIMSAPCPVVLVPWRDED